MILVSVCAILLCIGIIDALIFKSIKRGEANKLLAIQQELDQLQIEYKNKIRLMQKLRSREKMLRVQIADKKKSFSTPTKSSNKEPDHLAEKLLEQKLITTEQLKKAQKYQRSSRSGKTLVEILVYLDSIDQETVNSFLNT